MTNLEDKLRAAKPKAPDSLRRTVQEITATQPKHAWHLPALRQMVLVGAATLVLATFVAAVTMTRNSTTSPNYSSSSKPGATRQEASGGTTAGSALSNSSKDTTTSAPTIPDSTRPQQVGASLTVEVPSVDRLSAATQKVLVIVSNLGGWPTSVNYSTGQDGKPCTVRPIYEDNPLAGAPISSDIYVPPCEPVYARDGAAVIAITVPRSRFSEAFSELSALGKIVTQQLTITDLGQSNTDVKDQIKQLKAQIKNLRSQLAGSGLTSGERLMLRQELQGDLTNLEQLQAQLRQNGTTARYSTLSLTIQTPAKTVTPAHHGQAHKVFVKALDILIWQAVAVFWALAAILPAAVIALLIWLPSRRLRRRREQKLLS